MKTLIPLIEDFIRASRSKRRVQQNGKPVSSQTIRNYLNLIQLVKGYEVHTANAVSVVPINNKNAREYSKQKNYWKRFQRDFSDYLFDTLGHYDNYVGAQFKLLKSVFKWLSIEKGYNLGEIKDLFPVYKEEVPIVTLSTQQLQFLIHDHDFDARLPMRLKRVKDIFVFGCTVALRVSDILALKRTHIIKEGYSTYLITHSKKTHVHTKTLLPPYTIDIIQRNKSRSPYIFPRISYGNLNKYIKELIQLAGWDEIRVKTRTKRGLPHTIYKNKSNREHYRFYDHISTHTMRKTAITTFLKLGMDEWNVRQLSGHSPGSREFYRYVKYSQENVDIQSKIVHQKLQNFSN